MSTETQFWDLYGKLQASHAAIMELEAAVRSNPAVARAVITDVVALRNKQTELAVAFGTLYTAVTGSEPSGIAGLGAGPLVIAAWVAGGIVTLLAAWAVLWSYVKTTQAKAETAQASAFASAEANRQELLRQADIKDAQGDHAGADELRRQAGTPSGRGQDFSAWFQQNWGWLAAGAAAVLVLPELVKKI